MRHNLKSNRKCRTSTFWSSHKKKRRNLSLDQVKRLEDTNNLLSSSLDDLTISQIAENMENEHFVFQEMKDLSISQTMDQYLPGGVFNLDFPMCDEKFDLNEVDH